MSNKIHISQIYPCSEISTGSELYYICELGKYLAVEGYSLSLEGVIIPSNLYTSAFWDYFRMASHNNWVSETNIVSPMFAITPMLPINPSKLQNFIYFEGKGNNTKAKKYISELMNTVNICDNFIIPELREINFTNKVDNVWFYSAVTTGQKGESVTKYNLNTGNANQSLTSFVAYVAIQRLLTGYPTQLLLDLKDQSIATNQYYASNLILLTEETNAFSGWVLIDYYDYIRDSYEAWYFKHRDRGFLSRPYLISEKYDYATKTMGIQKGDVVFIYERAKKQNDNFIKEIKSCRLCIIEDINKSGVKVTIFNNRRTRLAEQREFDNLTTVNKALYLNSTSYKEARTRTTSYDWVSLGVDCCMFDELNFMSDLHKNDSLDILYSDGVCDKTVNLDVADAVYFLLKDYNMQFDEELFKSKYMQNTTPFYDRLVQEV